MNCQEALSLLYDVIDKEASQIDIQQVKEHLHKCKDCAGVYRLESSIDELLKAKLLAAKEAASPEVDTLQSKILTQLDAIDRQNQPSTLGGLENDSPTSSGSIGFGRWLAVAAAIVVVVGAGYFGLQVFDDHNVYLPLESAHWSASDNPAQYRNNVTTSLARVDTQQRLAYDISEQVGNFELLGGQMESIEGVDVAHFVYHNADNIVSVFVIDAAMMTLPNDLIETVVARNGVEFYDHNCRGCRLVYHRIGNALVVTATTNHKYDLLEFVPDRSPV